MSKVNIETMIPKAINLLSNEEKFGDGSIDSVYQGYISSFGVGIVQVGLLPTLAYFESEKNNEESEENRPRGDRRVISDLVCDTLEYDAESLLRYVIDNPTRKAELEEEIKDASVALKLSMRLFDLGSGGQS